MLTLTGAEGSPNLCYDNKNRFRMKFWIKKKMLK